MSVWGDPVLMGGGGSGGSVYHGTTEPSASLGSDGDVYIQRIPWSAEGMVDSGLGWAVREDCYCDDADAYLGQMSNGRQYYKTYDGASVVCSAHVESWDYYCPIVFSTVENNARFRDSGNEHRAPRSFDYHGTTWYVDWDNGYSTNYLMTGGIIGDQNLKRIEVPAEISTSEAVPGYILDAVGVCSPNPKTIVYKKISGTWAVQEEDD